jgi:hypothetical protein
MILYVFNSIQKYADESPKIFLFVREIDIIAISCKLYGCSKKQAMKIGFNFLGLAATKKSSTFLQRIFE